MSRTPSPLREQLLKAARDDAPPDTSVDRALEVADRDAPVARPVPRRWVVWALPAAAALFGVVAFAALRRTGEGDAPVAEPVTLPAGSVATPPVSEPTAIARPTPSASASASAAVAGPTPVPSMSAVAARPSPAGPRPGSPPAPATKPQPATAGGCPPNDLMCNMRQSQQQKKKKKDAP